MWEEGKKKLKKTPRKNGGKRQKERKKERMLFYHHHHHHHHHHHVVRLARISLTLSLHVSLSFIASGRSSGLHPVSSHSCCMYVRAGRLALRAISNKSWQQHPTRRQLYGHLPPITKTIQARRTRHAGHCWRSKDEIVSDVLLWTPAYGPFCHTRMKQQQKGLKT